MTLPPLPAIGDPIDSPFTSAVNAFNLLLFGFQLDEAASAGRITPATFVERLRVHTGGPGVEINKRYTQEQVAILAEQARLAALAVCVQAFDRALDETFGAKQPDDLGELSSARTIIFQVRNCFAHNPFAPTWQIHARYRRLITVPTVGVQLDGAARDGQPFTPDHVGGWEGLLKLLVFCSKQIAEQS